MGSRRRLMPGLRAAVAAATRISERAAVDPELSEPEAVVEALESLLQRQKAAMRQQRLRRQMEPRGPPERTLTRQAMEQIRHLRRELPEDWSVSRLAEGFQVSPDVVCRVLRSKFSPTLERGVKQDAKVLGALPGSPGQTARQEVLSAGDRTQQLLPLPQVPTLLADRTSDGGSSVSKGIQKQPWPGRARERQQQQQQEGGSPQGEPAPAWAGRVALPASGGQEEKWDRDILSEEELEELEASAREPPPKVVQRGREFFDSDGNFLYRLPDPQPG